MIFFSASAGYIIQTDEPVLGFKQSELGISLLLGVDRNKGHHISI